MKHLSKFKTFESYLNEYENTEISETEYYEKVGPRHNQESFDYSELLDKFEDSEVNRIKEFFTEKGGKTQFREQSKRDIILAKTNNRRKDTFFTIQKGKDTYFYVEVGYSNPQGVYVRNFWKCDDINGLIDTLNKLT